MDEKYQFWYPVITEVQPSLLDPTIEIQKEVLCKGHIIYGGRLLCREAKEATKNRYKAKKEKIVALRVPKVRLCEDCQRIYRTKEDSAYSAWVTGKPIPASGNKEVPVKI